MMARFFVSTAGLLTLNVFAVDLSASQPRALLDWCVARGADSFTVNVLGTHPGVERRGELLDERLALYAVPAREFPPIPESPPDGSWTQPRQLWRLTSDSAVILWSELKGDLVSCHYQPDEATWLEDPVLYRGSDVMLGVISHEGLGILRIWPDEERLLDEADIPYRSTGERVS